MAKPDLYKRPCITTIPAQGSQEFTIAASAKRNDSAGRREVVCHIIVVGKGRYDIEMKVRHDKTLKRELLRLVKKRYQLTNTHAIFFRPKGGNK